MTPPMIVTVDGDGGWTGDVKPSSEWRMHFDIYRNRPEAHAVVHVHSTCATFDTSELSTAMTTALDGRRACLLANHGQIAFGPTVEKAYRLTVDVETLARQYAVTRRFGTPVLIEPDEMDRVLGLFKTYGVQKKT